MGFFLQLSFDLIEEWIKKNPEASICTSEGTKAFKDIVNFQDYHGLPEFRNVRYALIFQIKINNVYVCMYVFNKLDVLDVIMK